MIDEIGNSSKNEGRNTSRLPAMDEEMRKYILGTADFFGLNYYTSRLIKPKADKSDKTVSWDNDFALDISVDPSWKRAKSEWLFSVPQGLRDLLVWIKNNYNNPPLYITENGWSDGGEIEDNGRIEYVTQHLISVSKAINEDKCNVVGYTVWSIVDNFEWLMGYSEKFGIYAVNMTSPTRERIAKKSVAFTKQVIQKKMVSSGASVMLPKLLLIASVISCIFFFNL